MNTVRSPFYNAIIPSAAAGPLFVFGLAAAYAFSQVPKPIEVGPEMLAAFFFGLVPVIVVGFVLSYFLNVMGAAILSAAGEVGEAGRDPVLWVGVGATAGLLLAFLFRALPDNGIASFAVIFTSAVCAGLCRAQTRWHDNP